MTSAANIALFVTPPHPCSYLESRASQMLFVDPRRTLNRQAFSELSRMGFRRSGDYVYKPECKGCAQCMSMRIRVSEFQPKRAHRRVMKKNADIYTQFIPSAEAGPMHYQLYSRYIYDRHQDGDMFPPSIEQFEKFLMHGNKDCYFMEFWKANQLIAVTVVDLLDDGISAVYSFFDTEHAHRSLGTYSILKQIEHCQKTKQQFVYLGYWVPESNKMNYKSSFTPFEILSGGEWRRFESVPNPIHEPEKLQWTLAKAGVFYKKPG